MQDNCSLQSPQNTIFSSTLINDCFAHTKCIFANMRMFDDENGWVAFKSCHVITADSKHSALGVITLITVVKRNQSLYEML